MVNFNVKNTSVLSNQEFVYMCQKYMRHKSEAVASQIKEIWQKMSTAEVANCLCLYGGEVHTGNLWELYFKTTEYKPFAKEVERVLLQKAVSENFVFLKIPHALSEENDGLDIVFNKIKKLESQCKFTTCTHENKYGCAVLDAVDKGIISIDELNRYKKLKIKQSGKNKEKIMKDKLNYYKTKKSHR